jgi:hypothetical protein
MSYKTTFAVDGHIHIYPHYDLNKAINRGIINLTHYAQKNGNISGEEVVPVWLLVERHDCNFFDQAVNNFNSNDLSISLGNEKETLVVKKDGKTILYIFAGRQLVTKENLEILSLTSNLYLKDKDYTIDEVIDQVLEHDGIPVINWAPGKWFFARGEVVKRILLKYNPNQLLIGDTSLRTTIWATPKLMADARKRGFKVIAGSDPLPFKNEEKQIGRYGFLMHGELDESYPAKSIKQLLRNSDTSINLVGKRNNPVTFFKRQVKIMM